MSALNIRDIGKDRRAVLDAEAKRQGVSVSELVRRFIDDGVEKERRAREKAEWIEAARPGLAYEAQQLEKHGPLLARFRPGYRSDDLS